MVRRVFSQGRCAAIRRDPVLQAAPKTAVNLVDSSDICSDYVTDGKRDPYPDNDDSRSNRLRHNVVDLTRSRPNYSAIKGGKIRPNPVLPAQAVGNCGAHVFQLAHSTYQN